MTTVTIDGQPVTVAMKPSAEVVLNIMRGRPYGTCPRAFADHDVYRFGARIHELRKLGFVITSERCTEHLHANYIEAYRIEGFRDE